MKPRSLADLREEMRAVARGEREAPPRPAASLMSALSSAEALDLLRLIWSERPATIGALAELSGRAQPNVSRSLQQLARLGLIRLMREGREVRPEPIVLAVELNFQTGTYEPKYAKVAV